MIILAARRRKYRAPIVYLDEIDVIQMATDAFRCLPKENFGLFIGGKHNGPKRMVYKIHFVLPIPNTKRTNSEVATSDKALKLFRKYYDFEPIGDFHSHPPDIDGKIYSEEPGYEDLSDDWESFGSEALFAIIRIKKTESAAEKRQKERAYIVRMKTKIFCFIGELEMEINFYTFKNGLTGLPKNKKEKSFYRKVHPRCVIRKKIRRKTNIKII